MNRAGGGRFECSGEGCIQRYPRLPDQGFWECVDDEGVVVCHGGEPAAGVHAADPDPGWLCGARRGAEGERVCVDASPDLPDGAARGYACDYEHSPGEQRRCNAVEGAPPLGAPCDGGGACVRGMACAGGRCLPRVLRPECWLDRDCGDGRWCRFGTCIEDAPPGGEPG